MGVTGSLQTSLWDFVDSERDTICAASDRHGLRSCAPIPQQHQLSTPYPAKTR